MSNETSLDTLRASIDRIDEQLQRLISERASLAKEVGRVKQMSGDVAFYRPEREALVLQKVKARNQGVIPENEMARLFREIMSVCLALEQPLTIAFLGPAGTYTQTAALKHFGHSVCTNPVGAIDEVFREVEAGDAHYGVVPIENSTEGMVNHTLDMFVRSPLQICGEVELRIHHHLLSKATDLKSVKRIYSHQQSFAQCREWLNANMAGVEHIVVKSNAEAARLSSLDPSTAAIAGETAAEIYQLNSLHKNIEDEPDNTTRFLVVGKQKTAPCGRDKTSLLLSTQNKPGALYLLLEPFKRLGLNMTRIESRPSKRGMWDYVFFVDIEGHSEEAHVKAALAEVARESAMFKILGSYPQAVI